MTRLDGTGIRTALTAVGELLADDDERIAIVVAGGASLNLLGFVERATTDVDVIARAPEGEGEELKPPAPFPAALDRAIRTVARDFELVEDWMNPEIGAQWSAGLPPWITEDIRWRHYGGGLDVGLVGRRTLIALKLFAAVDHDVSSVHLQDLLQLAPTNEELEEARRWVDEQDLVPEWSSMVERVVAHVERHR